MILGLPIFATVFAFALVVFIHELGHYLVGRLCGIGALVFSIGFGPKLFSFKDRNNTEWKLCLIPLGGYVKFLTDGDQKEHYQHNIGEYEGSRFKYNSFKTFEGAGLTSRFLTVLAGPTANFLLAIVIFSFLSNLVGVMSNEPIIGSVSKVPSQKEFFKRGDRVISVENYSIDNFNQIFEVAQRYSDSKSLKFEIVRDSEVLEFNFPYIFQPIVFGVEMFSPAMKAGVKTGDVFLEANQTVLESFSDLKEIINDSGGNDVSIKYWRNGQIGKLIIKPEMRPTETLDGNIKEVMRIGIRGGSIFSPERVKPSISEAIMIGFEMTVYVIRTSLVALVRMMDNSISTKHLSGPVGVAKALSQSAVEGLTPFLSLLAAISAGLGLVNLFPIPILDGGHLMLFLYEAIFKKPPSANFTRYLMAFGLAILVVIMVFVTFNDIMR